MVTLICPNCKNSLKPKNKDLFCSGCKQEFNSIGGIQQLLPRYLSSFKMSEKKFYSKEFEQKKNVSFNYVKEDYIQDSWGLMKHFDILANFPEKISILELGAGNGQYGLVLKQRGFKKVVITDISATGLIPAQHYAKQKSLPFDDSFYAVDAENLPFENASFDIIFMTATLHHLEDIPKAVSEIKRCLKLGGLSIIAVEPNRWYFKIVRPIAKILKIRRIQTGDSSIADEKTNGFTLKELKTYFREFDIIREQRVWYLTGIIFYLPDLVKRMLGFQLKIPKQIQLMANKIDRVIERIPLIKEFSFHITLIARKK